ncbi:DNA repair protein RecN [Geobacter metallireducens RCH3]|uniref:DNA repair protein RecN n=1 Tax=Geobacter metallireducens (strain ATCC 53774 / DSM 7210 / GS-15) TaxID=269799 RepID=Q39X40_GEOMG|nr:DNA repair protein RecN [Geobacter metallireducens]ABB31184.1 DNA repair ATPase RecN [Geobacter metallireducens GS-15]EHP84501.1 DNA repair protein RecN [Geobacter metallireducens RCH3]
MLIDLSIRNFAIIDTLHVPFQPGLTVFTGETGAGKSIIIDAVNLIMGGRASADLIRTGAEEATVEAVFALPEGSPLGARLADAGIECDGELLVKRVVSRSGRNRVFVGGGLSTQAILADMARELVNIYGQHESQTLLRTDNHLTLLDGFGGLLPLRESYGALYADYRATLDQIRALEEGEREAARRLDLLSFQASEIREAALHPGEDADLERERGLLAHGEKLLFASQEAYAALYGDDGAVLDRLAEVKGKVAEIAGIDASLGPLMDSLADAAAQLEDAAMTLRDYSSRVEADPARLERVEERLDLIRRLKKKYAPTVEEIVAYGEEAAREMEHLENRERTRGELDAALERLRKELAAKGGELSAKRRAVAKELQKAMEREIHQLAMKHALFEVAFEEFSEPRATGLERAEFLFSPNPGEEPKPLTKIASGGELSRLMLALKQVHPESDVPTLVFDEVDTGIGGATSALVGEKLKRVSRGQQVLCITHLPQVAAFADHHYLVEKRVEGGRTATAVTPLEGEARVAEMARMLGGVTITDRTLEHAREMIAHGAGA